jgi:hypothetical protein
VSEEGIEAQMPHPILTRVFGKPTHKQIKNIICKLLANLMAISCLSKHSKGHLGLLQDPDIYLARNGEDSTSIMLNLWPTQSSQQAPGLLTARNYVPPMLLLARHGTSTRWSSPSHATNLRRRSTMTTMLLLTTPPKVLTPSISAP